MPWMWCSGSACSMRSLDCHSQALTRVLTWLIMLRWVCKTPRVTATCCSLHTDCQHMPCCVSPTKTLAVVFRQRVFRQRVFRAVHPMAVTQGQPDGVTPFGGPVVPEVYMIKQPVDGRLPRCCTIDCATPSSDAGAAHSPSGGSAWRGAPPRAAARSCVSGLAMTTAGVQSSTTYWSCLWYGVLFR